MSEPTDRALGPTDLIEMLKETEPNGIVEVAVGDCLYPIRGMSLGWDMTKKCDVLTLLVEVTD